MTLQRWTFNEMMDDEDVENEHLFVKAEEAEAVIARLQECLDERTIQHKVQLDNAVRLQAENERLRELLRGVPIKKNGNEIIAIGVLLTDWLSRRDKVLKGGDE